jgi:hypothetical protein
VDGAAAGAWQPQLQAAPTQGLQEQAVVSVLMVFSLGCRGRNGQRSEVWALCRAGS